MSLCKAIEDEDGNIIGFRTLFGDRTLKDEDDWMVWFALNHPTWEEREVGGKIIFMKPTQ